MSAKPGGGGGTNPPTGFTYQNDERLLTVASITRMPKDERQWSYFVRELNKWIKNEVGSFDPTFSGFSAGPGQLSSQGPSVLWHRYGQIVTLSFYFDNGTSNATSFTITNLPDNITPTYPQTCQIGNLQDNGTEITAPCEVHISQAGVITFYPDNQSGAWTGTGTKGFTDTRTPQSIMYSLFEPSKL